MSNEVKLQILAIGAHPDDIEIGCGGALAKFAAKGHAVYLFIASDGSAGGDAALRYKEQQDAAAILGVTEVFWGNLIDTEIHIDKTTIMRIENIVQQIQPNMIFVNYPDDTHQDHRHLAADTISATRYVRNVLFYETPTTQNFQPNVFVDIGQTYLDYKLRALRAHASQINRTNIANLSILQVAESSAHFRGVQARVPFAEAFYSVRLFINI